MKTQALNFAIAFSTLAFTLSAQAHAPKEHTKNAEKPNCAAMKNIDHSKMDMTDPVMQAMMKQCVKDVNHDEKPDGSGHKQSEHDAPTGEKESTEHKH